VSLTSELDGPYAKVSAVAIVKKKGGKAKLVVSIAPKDGHSLNGEGQPELEIEVKPPAGFTIKAPILKDKKGVTKKAREFTLELDVDAKAASGEVVVNVEVRLVDISGKEKTPRIVQLAVPVVVP
jgi:hypothetical protein